MRQGVRPDVAVTIQQFGHWVTPFAKDLNVPNLNQLAPLSLALTDATGSGADVVRVRIYRADAPREPEADASGLLRGQYGKMAAPAGEW